MAKGGYLSWNPMKWFQSAPAEPAPIAMAQPTPPAPVSTTRPAPVGGPYGGKKRKTRRGSRGKKAAKKTGRRKH
jgi:hypothetical protein